MKKLFTISLILCSLISRGQSKTGEATLTISKSNTHFTQFIVGSSSAPVAFVKNDTLHINDSLGLIKVLLKMELDRNQKYATENYHPLKFEDIKYPK